MFVTSTGEDHESVSWYLEEFVFGKDLTVKDNTTIFVDRATHEFGFVFYPGASEVAFVAQFPDTEEPAFFSAKDALAACWHSKSRKVTLLLLQQTQVSLKFPTSSEARAFLDAFEDAAATAHNISFTTYEHESLNKFKAEGFDMVNENIAGRVVQPWMNAHSKPSSEWPR
jgi:histone acetyltransferase HTATIP